MTEKLVFMDMTDIPKFSSKQSMKRILKSVCTGLLGPVGLMSCKASSLLTDSCRFLCPHLTWPLPCAHGEKLSGLSFSYEDISPTVLRPHPSDLI